MLNPKKIPPQIGYYLAGFADGEGSFNVSFRKREDYNTKWKISLCFNISQKDPVILSTFKRYLRCGTMRKRKDGVWYYEVNNFNSILENVIPFFSHFRFRSQKMKRAFSKFKKITQILKSEKPITKDILKEVLELRNEMNETHKRKFSDDEILKDFSSSETIRQTK